MLYTVKIVKRKKLWQKAFTIKDNEIYITDTKRAKKKFLKSNIRNAVFEADVAEDALFKGFVKRMSCYDEAFLFDFLEEMLLQLVCFLKIKLPVDTLAISSSKAKSVAVRYAKTVIIVGEEGEDMVVDGVNVIYVKKLKKLPDMAIILGKGKLLPFAGVPTVDISKEAKSTIWCMSWEAMSFQSSLLPYEISCESLMYLIKNEGEVKYRLTSCRKKLPPLFTFS